MAVLLSSCKVSRDGICESMIRKAERDREKARPALGLRAVRRFSLDADRRGSRLSRRSCSIKNWEAQWRWSLIPSRFRTWSW